jgi:hypothetical protein
VDRVVLFGKNVKYREKVYIAYRKKEMKSDAILCSEKIEPIKYNSVKEVEEIGAGIDRNERKRDGNSKYTNFDSTETKLFNHRPKLFNTNRCPRCTIYCDLNSEKCVICDYKFNYSFLKHGETELESPLSRMKTNKEINILLLGETGVWKR